MILVTGGVKSGKSSFALKLSEEYNKKAFLATGVPFDEEMKKRIEKHKAERGNDFDTYEEPINVPDTLNSIADKYDVIVFECVTTYLGNLYYYAVNIDNYLDKLLESFKNVKCELIIVTNEVGWGVIPENELARKYVETLGKLNSKIANISDQVYLVVSGIGVRIK
ncbi:bifunctional adenosylcobinamide kinase/adenosylcobinamide-phosphate guanylyltransferase [Fervidobacterium nodosum]|uniref:Adenosylcobinamide kinase n=1 Tax=Fervidobacterium nodosum (strain ATCC 35602 / DSM 5306 / Rt17-B1) TaxID=381764 RepID=A7HMT0_FERNB|nr:bifunctional adenosylcobinamide kinase/adenosylcobinamide-phosphate guanylyltransferase [Fervidobacterium nodosum]ABS61213.1 cobalbumin biosynthesis protein [Fervidobacterium nodosum Rt17-B1]PHJ13949.1 cobalamin biosynthesis protein [Fervidobacterium sp. SC_NGM5_G05]